MTSTPTERVHSITELLARHNIQLNVNSVASAGIYTHISYTTTPKTDLKRTRELVEQADSNTHTSEHVIILHRPSMIVEALATASIDIEDIEAEHDIQWRDVEHWAVEHLRIYIQTKSGATYVTDMDDQLFEFADLTIPYAVHTYGLPLNNLPPPTPFSERPMRSERTTAQIEVTASASIEIDIEDVEQKLRISWLKDVCAWSIENPSYMLVNLHNGEARKYELQDYFDFAEKRTPISASARKVDSEII